MRPYFKNNFVTLSYNPELRLGKACWTGRLQGAELRETFLLSLELVNQFSITRWLADDRLMGTIEPADLEWGMNVFVPRIANSSLLRFARLPSQYGNNREAVETMIDKGQNYKHSLVVRDFADEQEAMSWLLQPLP